MVSEKSKEEVQEPTVEGPETWILICLGEVAVNLHMALGVRCKFYFAHHVNLHMWMWPGTRMHYPKAWQGMTWEKN